jgi:hypothetical protein
LGIPAGHLNKEGLGRCRFLPMRRADRLTDEDEGFTQVSDPKEDRPDLSETAGAEVKAEA